MGGGRYLQKPRKLPVPVPFSSFHLFLLFPCGIDCTERQIRSPEDLFAKVSNMIQT
jgi:hypothetical protein